jgi:hypothetical protein
MQALAVACIRVLAVAHTRGQVGGCTPAPVEVLTPAREAASTRVPAVALTPAREAVCTRVPVAALTLDPAEGSTPVAVVVCTPAPTPTRTWQFIRPGRCW